MVYRTLATARPAVALAFALALAPAAAAGEPQAWFADLPKSVGVGEVTVLPNPGFVVGYSESRRQALWVAWRAETLKGTPRLAPRPRFETDSRTRARVQWSDYRGSGLTRGHLAPNYLIGKLYGVEAQRATFLMSNIAPQSHRLNELLWQRLEEAESTFVAPRAVQLWVLAGPLFGERPAVLKSGIPVPEAFYRVWLDVEAGAPRVLAFIAPQEVCGTEPLSRYLVTVDEIERRAGLDFFTALADPEEDALERSRETAGWDLGRFDRRPPRYGGRYESQECETGRYDPSRPQAFKVAQVFGRSSEELFFPVTQ